MAWAILARAILVLIFCDSIGAFSDIKLINACQHDFADAILIQNPGKFTYFFLGVTVSA